MGGNQLGYLPPQAIDIEKAVLGALMLEKDIFFKISSYVHPETFYVESHRYIYAAIQRLNDGHSHVDMLTVTQQLRKDEKLDLIGGPFYLTELMDQVVQTASVEGYALILNQKYLERELIQLCQDYTRSVYEGTQDVFDLYDELSAEIFKKVSVNAGKQAIAFADIFRERLKVYEQPATQGLTGITSGYKSVDEKTGGWQNSDLIILAARPGMGKTAFMLNLARNAAINGDRPGAIFSLEMSKEQLVDRMVSAETEVYLEKFKNRSLTEIDWQKLNTRMNGLINSGVFIDDTPALPIQVLRSKAIRLKHKFKIGWIVIDYLQLMRGEREGKNSNREQEISSISRGLKALAKELDIPVIALSQLSRAVESRPKHQRTPLLSDLRESGAIEQDADIVVFLYRPEYYDINEDAEGNSLEGVCQVIFAKNRQGAAGSAFVRFNGAMMKFIDYETDYDEGFGTLTPSTNFIEDPF